MTTTETNVDEVENATTTDSTAPIFTSADSQQDIDAQNLESNNEPLASEPSNNESASHESPNRETPYADKFAARAHKPKPSSSGSTPIPDTTFNLKGSMLTMMVLELHEYNYNRFNVQMTMAAKRAPNFFQQTPIVISLEKLHD